MLPALTLENYTTLVPIGFLALRVESWYGLIPQRRVYAATSCRASELPIAAGHIVAWDFWIVQ